MWHISVYVIFCQLSRNCWNVCENVFF